MFCFGNRKEPPFFPTGVPSLARITRTTLTLIALFVFPSLAAAQQNDAFSDSYMQAIAKRNDVYCLASQRLTPPVVAKLGPEEAAWVYFTSEEKALMDTLQSENLISATLTDAHSIAVVEAQTKHLQAFFVDHHINFPPQFTPQDRDQELNRAYADCMSRLTESDQKLLKTSERAWLAYRDADLAAVVASNRDPSWKNAAIVHLDTLRTEQLVAIGQALSPAPITPTPTQELPSPPSPPPQEISPNLEDIKAVYQFQDEAKGVLKSLIDKKDDPFFKQADAIKNVPELPADISAQISNLDTKYAGLLQKPDSDKLLQPALNECSAVELLVSWSIFAHKFRAGSLDEAGRVILKALSQKPTDITPAYLPVWQTVGNWQAVFLTDESKYFEHIGKAERLAALGKSSAAITEYQAAYDLIQTPNIPEKIKQLRLESLGL